MTRWRVVSLGLAFLSAGVARAESNTDTPEAMVLTYRYEDALKALRGAVEKKDDKNYALYNLTYGIAGLESGDLAAARAGFSRALEVMQSDIGSDLEVASVFLDASMKYFKGDVYEKQLASTWLALTEYWLGRLDAAKAAIGIGAAADRKLSKGAAAEDYALGFYLEGRILARAGDTAGAKAAYEKARAALGGKDVPLLSDERTASDNVVFVVGLGMPPVKHPSKWSESMPTADKAEYPEAGVEVFVDGKSVGKGVPMFDAYAQYKGTDTAGQQMAAMAKGAALNQVTKQLGMFGGIVKATTNITRPDIRTCPIMPGEVHVVSARVEPGLHTVTVEFLDSKGKRLERYRQVHPLVAVPASGDTILWFRSGLDAGNVAAERAKLKAGNRETYDYRGDEPRWIATYHRYY